MELADLGSVVIVIADIEGKVVSVDHNKSARSVNSHVSKFLSFCDREGDYEVKAVTRFLDSNGKQFLQYTLQRR